MALLDLQVYLFFLAIRGRIVEGAFCEGKVEYLLVNFWIIIIINKMQCRCWSDCLKKQKKFFINFLPTKITRD